MPNVICAHVFSAFGSVRMNIYLKTQNNTKVRAATAVQQVNRIMEYILTHSVALQVTFNIHYQHQYKNNNKNILSGVHLFAFYE